MLHVSGCICRLWHAEHGVSFAAGFTHSVEHWKNVRTISITCKISHMHWMVHKDIVNFSTMEYESRLGGLHVLQDASWIYCWLSQAFISDKWNIVWPGRSVHRKNHVAVTVSQEMLKCHRTIHVHVTMSVCHISPVILVSLDMTICVSCSKPIFNYIFNVQWWETYVFEWMSHEIVMLWQCHRNLYEML